MFQLQLFFLLHCDEWDRVVTLPRHTFVTGVTLLQLNVDIKTRVNRNSTTSTFLFVLSLDESCDHAV
jgi:hypothetical protein